MAIAVQSQSQGKREKIEFVVQELEHPHALAVSKPHQPPELIQRVA